jgi:serine/threonine-protein kinase
MAPEQILGMEVDGRADIYATGTMLFQMLVGDLPLPEFDSKPAFLKHKLTHKDGMFEKMPSEMDQAIHPQMDDIIQKATAYQPAQRYDNCRKFLEDLEMYQKNHGN